MNYLLYLFGRSVFLLYLKIFFRIKIGGTEHVPDRKPFIICANHISWLDPMAVAAALPAGYRIHFMAKSELFSNFILAFLLRGAGAFPVNRKESDFKAFKTACRLIGEGKVVGLFPEGSRSRDGRLQEAHGGTALIAIRSGAPILPVAIKGPYRLFRPLQVTIGPLFTLPPLVYKGKEERNIRLAEMSTIIMANIATLIDTLDAGDGYDIREK